MYNLPKTWATLESLSEETSGNGGFLLRGHNVVGTSSAPNLVALWSGKVKLVGLCFTVLRLYDTTHLSEVRGMLCNMYQESFSR
jgi:hypothetical protein